MRQGYAINSAPPLVATKDNFGIDGAADAAGMGYTASDLRLVSPSDPENSSVAGALSSSRPLELRQTRLASDLFPAADYFMKEPDGAEIAPTRRKWKKVRAQHAGHARIGKNLIRASDG